MKDSQLLHQKDAWLLEGGKAFPACNSHPRRWGRNKPATMTSLASFTKGKLQTTRSNVVQAAVPCKLPQSTGLESQLLEIHHHPLSQQHLWGNSKTCLRSSCRILLFKWGLSIYERNMLVSQQQRTLQQNKTILFCATTFKGMEFLKVYRLE